MTTSLQQLIKYAGIGSRETPTATLEVMEAIARALGSRGATLRSGAAAGADTAFERGAVASGGPMEIYLPWSGFQGRKAGGPFMDTGMDPRALEMVMSGPMAHPAPGRLNPKAKKFMTRNFHQLLGKNLDDPVDLVTAWTEGGKFHPSKYRGEYKGTGTAQNIRAAKHLGIPVLNLGSPRSDLLKTLKPEKMDEKTFEKMIDYLLENLY